MRTQFLKLVPPVVVLCALAFCPNTSSQIQNPIQAAKDAYNKAKQQGQQQSQPTLVASAAAPANPQMSPAASGDCCTADAQKKLAASLGFVDIVGIKLGMSPKEVTDALKASSPQLGVKLYTTRLTMPSNTNFKPLPLYMVAHKSPAPARDHSEEYIIVEFTTPPNSPVVARVFRRVQFADGQAVAAGTLISALQKKYGTENNINSIYHRWIYQNNGQPLKVPLSGTAVACQGVNGNQDGSYPSPPVNDNNPSTEWTFTHIDLQTASQPDGSDVAPPCTAYVSVVAAVNSPNPGDPSSLTQSMTVAMQSAALIHNSRVATQAWLQADLDAKNKKTTDDGAARSAPKL